MRYLLTGGGTGGHVYPALAIADELGRRPAEAQFLYVGRSDKLDRKSVVEGESVDLGGRRSSKKKNISSPALPPQPHTDTAP